MESGCRRLWVLVDGLPPQAAVWREDEVWTTQDELAASQIEVADMWGRILAQLLRAKPRRLPKPIRVPRPGERSERRPERDTNAIVDWFRRHIK